MYIYTCINRTSPHIYRIYIHRLYKCIFTYMHKQNEPSPISTMTISEKCTEKLVEEVLFFFFQRASSP